MKKNVIALAVAAAMAAPLAAQAAPTVYGKAHLSIDAVKVKESSAAATDGDTLTDNYQVNSRASRVGVKGSEDLGGGLTAVYQMEWQVNMSKDGNGTTSGAVKQNAGDNISARNQFIGLAGSFGTFVVGRHDTPMKMSTGKLDFFSDEAGDYNKTVGFHDLRANNAIAYITPTFSGLTVAAAVVPGEGSGAKGCKSGDNCNASGLTDAYSVAAMYANGPLYVSAAVESINADIIDATTTNKGGDDFNKTRVGVGYNVAGFDLAFIYENQDLGKNGTLAVGNRDLMQLQAKYTMGANVIKAMYGTADDWSNDKALGAAAKGKTGQTAMGVGFDHNFSKSTKAYAQYVSVTTDDATIDLATKAVNDTTTFSLGMVTKF